MKRNILVLAIALTSIGTFAQTGMNELKNVGNEIKATELKKDDVKNLVEEKKTEGLKNVKEVVAEKEVKVKEAVAEKATIEVETIDKVVETVETKVTEVSEEKVAAKAKRNEELDAIAGDSEKIAARRVELKNQVEEQEAIKEDKKASLLEKITALKDKITAAEEKLGLLEKAGISPADLLSKTAIIDNAKTKLAGLTSTFM